MTTDTATVTINDTVYTYAPSTPDVMRDLWSVEIGKGASAYRSRYGYCEPARALFHFNGINVGNGFKVRLVLRRADGTSTLIARRAS